MPCGIMQEKARVRLHEKTNINTEESFMYCVRKVLEDLWWVGGNDRRLAMFEGVYAVPNGVSYNSYLLLDEVWGFDYFGDTRTVDVHIKRLREKLEGVSDQWDLKTVWSVGYKFEVK